MIAGLGMDLVQVSRVRASLARYGERFLDRVFTPGERAYSARLSDPAESLAARFAAKEAAAKALGIGIAQTVGWKDFEVVREAKGPPRLVLHGHAAALAESRDIRRIHLSLTHTGESAGAIVIFERE